MKRILTLTLALAMSLSLLTACGSSNDSAAPSGDDGSDAAGETVTDRSTVSKIAVLLPGSITDESWNQTAYEGLYRKRGLQRHGGRVPQLLRGGL